jgi:hypothetical protein
MLVSAQACEPYIHLVIENKTEQTLSVFVDGVLIGKIEPGNQITEKYPGGSFKYKYSIVAKNEQGEIIFSEKISQQQMQYVGSGNYKVVIPPLIIAPVNSDNATAK